MKKIIIIFGLILPLYSQTQIHQNLIILYAEGPVGQHYGNDFEVKTYSELEGVRLAKKDILEYLSAMIYGYRFEYQIENKLINRTSRFHLELINQINEFDQNLSLRQLEQSENSIRVQALYKLREEHKYSIKGNQSLSAQYSGGQAIGKDGLSWDQRSGVYQQAIEEAILYHARKNIKSRPLEIRGKVFLKESPLFFIYQGNWRVVVKINISIEKIEYEHSY